MTGPRTPGPSTPTTTRHRGRARQHGRRPLRRGPPKPSTDDSSSLPSSRRMPPPPGILPTSTLRPSRAPTASLRDRRKRRPLTAWSSQLTENHPHHHPAALRVTLLVQVKNRQPRRSPWSAHTRPAASDQLAPCEAEGRLAWAIGNLCIIMREAARDATSPSQRRCPSRQWMLAERIHVHAE